LAQQYTLCAFSNTNATHAASFTYHFGTELSHFETLYLSQEVGQRKPDTQAFLTVCDRMGYAPKDGVFLDDTQENVMGAKAAGLEAYLTRGETQVARQLTILLERLN
jgi:putative hydrolase of the HAD superfamily